jgi:hypothetical protein
VCSLAIIEDRPAQVRPLEAGAVDSGSRQRYAGHGTAGQICAGEVTAVHRRADQHAVAQVGVAEVGVVQARVGKVGLQHQRIGELGAGQVGAARDDRGKLSRHAVELQVLRVTLGIVPRKLGFPDVRVDHGGIRHVDPAHAGPTQVRPGQVGPDQARHPQVRAEQVGRTQTDPVQTATVQARTGHVRFGEVEVGKIPVAQVVERQHGAPATGLTRQEGLVRSQDRDQFRVADRGPAQRRSLVARPVAHVGGPLEIASTRRNVLDLKSRLTAYDGTSLRDAICGIGVYKRPEAPAGPIQLLISLRVMPSATVTSRTVTKPASSRRG